MLELTPEQAQAVEQANPPPVVVNPKTHEEFVLLRKDRYEAMRKWMAPFKRRWDDPADNDLIRRPENPKGALSYGQLYEQLRALGFTQRGFEWEGTPRYVCEHKTIPNAIIFLPDCDRSEPVEPFHMNGVLAMLKSHDLLPKYNPLMT